MHTVNGEWECAQCGKPCDPVRELNEALGRLMPEFEEDNRYMRAHEYPGIGEERFKRLLDTVENMRREAMEEGARLALEHAVHIWDSDHEPIAPPMDLKTLVKRMIYNRDYGFPVSE